MTRVLVLGGGIGGVEAAISLRREGFPVTLVSDRDYYYLYPISIWIPTRETEFERVQIPLRELADTHGFDLVIGSVQSIAAGERRVVLHTGAELAFDYLVVALGADKVGHSGLEYTLSICGQPEGALALRERLDHLLARGEGRIAMGFGGNPKDPSAVRGGPAFELVFNVHNLLKKKGLRERFEITFFAPMENPGSRMGTRAAGSMEKMLKRLNIRPHFGKKIKEFVPDGIVFADGTKLLSDLTMFIPAGAGKAVLQESDLPLTEAGFVRINDYCQVEGHEHVYAIGDAAAIEGPEWRAKQGHLADVMARNVAFNIAAAERGVATRKGYREHINILCVMDTGDGAVLVYRDQHREVMLPMPLLGHQLKKAWAVYYSLSKRKRLPRLAGARAAGSS